MNTIHTVVIGDSRSMQELEDQSIDLVITSPPYWQLKDYGAFGQIGYNQSYEEYINHLNLVWKETWRVLDGGCRLCINIGDQFARSIYYGRYKVIPIRTEIIKFCEAIGFDYMGAVIWQKVSTTNTTGGATVMGSFPYPRNGILKIDYEFILIFKKIGDSHRKVSKQDREKSRLTKEEWNDYFSGHWNFSGVKQEKHLAMFPIELPYRLIKMFSFVGDIVLDPFLGSGTTCRAAIELNRNSYGYEVNPSFLPLIRDKLGTSEKRLFDQPELQIIHQKTPEKNFDAEIENLAYRFRDPLKLNIKIDPKKFSFGSKIDHNSGEREQYYTVKEIISPEILVLDNSVKIKLIGIRQKEEKNEEAMEYLNGVLKGQKVFLKFDETKYDHKRNLLCYLYLKNKTFINARLIKNDLVLSDDRIDFKFKEKFKRLMKKTDDQKTDFGIEAIDETKREMERLRN